MENLVIINRSPQDANFNFGQTIWKTCLRQINFTNQYDLKKINLLPSDLVLSDEKALIFLTEVLCGLESPVFGETEVFGQFKKFVFDLNSSSSDFNINLNQNSKWIQFIYNLVKNIRTDYITGLGSNSYGSTLRKLTHGNQSLTFIGAGQLVSEILPWVSKNKKIQLLVRDTEKHVDIIKTYKEISIEKISSLKSFNQVLIIAAPIDNNDLISLIANVEKKPDFIYDLRDQGFEGLKQNIKNIRMLSLSDFFKIFNNDKIKFELIKTEIKKIIAQKVFDFNQRAEVRPLGWDDLC